MTEAPPRWLDYVDLDELVVAEANPKDHALGVIAANMAEHGLFDVVAIQDERTGRMLAGHGRREELLAERARGAPPPEGTIVTPEGRWLVPCLRGWASKDDDHARAAGTAHNQATTAGGWKRDELEDLVRHLNESSPLLVPTLGFGDDELAELLAQPEPDRLGGGDPDELPEDVPAVTKPGDVWLLGEHRLMCGDAFDREAVRSALGGADRYHLITDPPYGMGLDTGRYGDAAHPSAFAAEGQVDWDQVPFDVVALLALHAGRLSAALWGANYFHDRVPLGTWWVWDKRTSEAADALQGVPFELLWIEGKRAHEIIRHNWAGITARERTGLDKGVRYHPTQKPVEVMARVVEYLSEPSDVVLDPFIGSGTTLLAAHRESRICYGMEVNPSYCDVVAKRWQTLTGERPILEATGEAHDFGA